MQTAFSLPQRSTTVLREGKKMTKKQEVPNPKEKTLQGYIPCKVFKHYHIVKIYLFLFCANMAFPRFHLARPKMCRK